MNKRLAWLSGVLLIVLGIRAWDPLGEDGMAPAAASEAVTRPNSAPGVAAGVLAKTAAAPAAMGNANWPLRPRMASAPQGNAFMPRTTSIAAPPPPPVMQMPQPVYTPPPAPPPPPSPPPLQVIGTWEDGDTPGVFLSSPGGTLLARPGEVLMAEYKVQSISPQQVSLLHLPSQRTWLLSVPKVTATDRWPSR